MKVNVIAKRVVIAALAVLLCGIAFCIVVTFMEMSPKSASDNFALADFTDYGTPVTVVNGTKSVSTDIVPTVAKTSSGVQGPIESSNDAVREYVIDQDDEGELIVLPGPATDAAISFDTSAQPATTNPSATSSQPAPAPVQYSCDCLYIKGETIPYVDSYKTASAPSSGAGLWLGSDSTTDGSWGYFIGHNPGDFHVVSGLHDGDCVTVCDSDGNVRTYTVYSVFDVPNTSSWNDVKTYVEGHGESVTLQTCVENNCYRIILAQ